MKRLHAYTAAALVAAALTAPTAPAATAGWGRPTVRPVGFHAHGRFQRPRRRIHRGDFDVVATGAFGRPR